MAKFVLFSLVLSFSVFAADAVSLSQKGNTITVTITTDGAALNAEYTKALADLEAQRAESLKDKVTTVNGVETARVSLTQQQKDFVNATFDARIVDYKRMLQLKMLDQVSKILQTSIQRASVSDTDIAAEKAAAKAKIDEEYAKKEALKPSVDADFNKALPPAEKQP